MDNFCPCYYLECEDLHGFDLLFSIEVIIFFSGILNFLLLALFTIRKARIAAKIQVILDFVIIKNGGALPFHTKRVSRNTKHHLTHNEILANAITNTLI